MEAAGPSETVLIIVRHGERLDEADRAAWHRIRTRENWSDAPLTKTGWNQASQAGRDIRRKLQGFGLQPDCIYASPTSRTLSTAAALARELVVNSVTPAYALNCCAAARRRGVRSFPQTEPGEETMAGVAVAAWPPLGDADSIDQDLAKGRGFVRPVCELASSHSPGDVIVLVTHREGIWELAKSLRQRPTTKYCSQDYLSYSHDTGKLGEWVPPKAAAAAAAAAALPARRLPDARDASRDASEPGASDAFELALAAGRTGVSILAPSDGSPVLLLHTPGVPDLYSDGGPLPPGERVELLSGTNTSEGEGGGAFVLVRRSSGAEGWLSVEHAQLDAVLGRPAAARAPPSSRSSAAPALSGTRRAAERPSSGNRSAAAGPGSRPLAARPPSGNTPVAANASSRGSAPQQGQGARRWRRTP